jgi:glycosyltransferase involved in cell wall biosynthesis
MAYYNRKALLYNSLKSIVKTACLSEYEVILVDDNSRESERVENLQKEFPFLQVIRIEQYQKSHINPCVAYNLGFAYCSGDIIILQNPECEHVGDILSYVEKNLTEENYLSFACYAPDYRDDEHWYNHPLHRPVYYHFCSAITKTNLQKLGGFDVRYAQGYAYDDVEFVERITRLGLKKEIPTNPYVIHHKHSKDYGLTMEERDKGLKRNKAIFELLTKKETEVYKVPCYVEG